MSVVSGRDFFTHNGQLTTNKEQLITTLRMSEKITYLAYNRSGGD
ncbi:MAG: hypothetical protein ACKPFD_14330 [Dolichospermum sp.]